MSQSLHCSPCCWVPPLLPTNLALKGTLNQSAQLALHDSRLCPSSHPVCPVPCCCALPLHPSLTCIGSASTGGSSYGNWNMLGCCCCSMVCCWPCRTRGGSCGGGGMRRRRCPSCSSRLSPSCTLTQASSRHHGVSKNIAGSMDTAAAHGAQHKLSVPQWGVPAAASYMMGCQPGHMRLTSILTSLFQPSTTNTSSAKPSVVLNTCASRMFRPKSPCSSTSSNISAQKTYNPAPKMHLTAKLLDRLQLTTAGCNNCMCTKHLLLHGWPPVLCKKHWALWRGLVRHAHHTTMW